MKKSNNVSSSCLILVSMLLLMAGCSDAPIPKPKGYFKIALDDKVLESYDGDCPLEFQKPTYAQVQFLNRGTTDSCWFNLHFPKHNAVVYMTYLSVNDNLDQLYRDSYEFVYKHDVKANSIERIRINSKDSTTTGLLYDLKGQVATPLQFYVSDSSDHFLRGSLYFNHSPNPDSIRPVLNHLREDVITLMETIQWK